MVCPVVQSGTQLRRGWRESLVGLHDLDDLPEALLSRSNLFRARLDYPSLKAKATDLAKRHKPMKILIEDTGVGKQG